MKKNHHLSVHVHFFVMTDFVCSWKLRPPPMYFSLILAAHSNPSYRHQSAYNFGSPQFRCRTNLVGLSHPLIETCLHYESQGFKEGTFAKEARGQDRHFTEIK